ncbi:hypothetical protein D9758_010785 [Tetrapyrgos nigripes]|uniref:Epoxide hydrolase N-terminal domain-containing protein n=1 Tax=Tetrapyrgos nigripes TaxID=182062 RepID=A0A8H5FYJ5_9AGAR|nr:hypothetical protein D9758_010785 [Tetrapyrgos nigripes]
MPVSEHPAPNVEPYRIRVPEHKLELLAQKLRLTTFPDEIEEAGWDYGVPISDIRRLVSRWKEGFDWRKQEETLNEELPQFTVDIEVEKYGSLNVHFVHKRSVCEDAIPLLFVHGWPGSFIEVRKILPLLVEPSPSHPGFHVVAMSLPGYGFSEAPSKRGFAMSQMAETANKLMLALGYSEYVTQGGDMGFMVTRKIAQSYGHKHCKAWHTNSPVPSIPSFWTKPIEFLLSFVLLPWTAAEKAGIERTTWFAQEGSGYANLHMTQPQTPGYSLADSPVGLLAWITEKLVNWSDGYPWSDDEILTWVSIYLFSRAGPAASLRLYYEMRKEGEIAIPPAVPPVTVPPSTIPLGLSYFPKEIVILPRRLNHSIGKIVLESEHSSGGHFAAYERPVELVDDVRRMFGKDGPAFGVVSGRTGYH